mmetsp:Transcript_107708/g.246674  ORF Transcript_107708/g.246674 Transcript_107708/m.246674 type:complete len:234 (-) Transcript_107708:2867-3568(-)
MHHLACTRMRITDALWHTLLCATVLRGVHGHADEHGGDHVMLWLLTEGGLRQRQPYQPPPQEPAWQASSPKTNKVQHRSCKIPIHSIENQMICATVSCSSKGWRLPARNFADFADWNNCCNPPNSRVLGAHTPPIPTTPHATHSHTLIGSPRQALTTNNNDSTRAGRPKRGSPWGILCLLCYPHWDPQAIHFRHTAIFPAGLPGALQPQLCCRRSLKSVNFDLPHLTRPPDET